MRGLTVDPAPGPESPAYRPVSSLAVAAAAVGCAAALAIVSPMFWLVPIVGVALSWAALAEVTRPAAMKVGRLAALAGLALSLGFGTQAVTAAAAAEWLARSRAEAATRFWLETIASGRLDDARAMCLADAAPSVDRVAADGRALGGAIRYRGRDEATGGRIVRASGGGLIVDVVLAVDPPRPGDAAERFMVVRCDDVTPSAS